MSKIFLCLGCGLKSNLDFKSNNRDYCYMCNQFFSDKYIFELKAKLAESESKLRVSNSSLASSQLEYDKLKKEYDEQEKLLSQYLASNSRLQFEYDQLKQQLAEKEKENKRLKFDLAMYRSANELINRFGIEKARDVMFQTEKTKKQGQIDYAVEQLEQLRIKIKNRVKDWNTGIDYEFSDMLPDYDIYEEIDNQIEQLKEATNENNE